MPHPHKAIHPGRVPDNPATRDFLEQLSEGLSGFPRARRILLGCSGGKDSVALAHGLDLLGWKKVVLCHFDHRLRGTASKSDARFVRNLAANLGWKFLLGTAPPHSLSAIPGVSTETAARNARHDFFARCARAENCGNVLLAHHSGDQVETILHNLFRGTGPSGLAGMRKISTIQVGRRTLTLVRPMLRIAPTLPGDFLLQNQWPWVEDASNRSMEFTRNRIRSVLLPAIEMALGREIAGPILRLREILLAEDDFLGLLAAEFPVEKKLPTNQLAALHPALQRRVVRLWLIARGIVEPGFREVEEVRALAAPGETTAKVNLPGARHARRRAGLLFVE